MLQALAAIIRRRAAGEYGDGDHRIQQNPRGDLCMAPALPLKAELTRMGDSWSCAIATASAFTFVAAWPTTRAELVLFNGEPTGGKSYLIDSAWLTNITSQAAAQPFSLLGQLALTGIAAPTDDTAQLIFSRSSRRQYGGQAKRAVASTAFALANKWEIIGNSAISPMTTNLGASIYVDLFGGWLVPPGGAFCLAGLAGTAAGTAIAGLTWHEVQLPVAA